MQRSQGFTLIEVLIAMVILAVGLLGLAALQASSLKNNQSAYYRSQATQLASDIADRMRANMAGKGGYLSNPTTAEQKNNCTTTVGCTAEEMAENDLFEWNRAIQNILPGANDSKAFGNIEQVQSVADGIDTYTVTIRWNDNRDDDIDWGGESADSDDADNDDDGDTDMDPSFKMSFRL
jgi:type IV pilus assembly protein PilV